MPLASYLENITEKLNEAQSNFREEIKALRARLANSDLADRDAIGADITAFKQRLNRFLDELETRSQKIFADAAVKLRDRDVNLVALMNKREGQLSDAREKRDDALAKRTRAREVNANLIAERDRLAKECDKLQTENVELKRKLSDQHDWKTATKDIKRR